MLSLPEAGLAWCLVHSQGPQLCLKVYQPFTFYLGGKNWSFAIFLHTVPLRLWDCTTGTHAQTLDFFFLFDCLGIVDF